MKSEAIAGAGIPGADIVPGASLRDPRARLAKPLPIHPLAPDPASTFSATPLALAPDTAVVFSVDVHNASEDAAVTLDLAAAGTGVATATDAGGTIATGADSAPSTSEVTVTAACTA